MLKKIFWKKAERRKSFANETLQKAAQNKSVEIYPTQPVIQINDDIYPQECILCRLPQDVLKIILANLGTVDALATISLSSKYFYFMLKSRLKELRETYVVNINDFQKLNLIGTGSFAQVYVATHKATNQTYALKQFNKEKMVTMSEAEHTKHQLDILKIMDHPFLVKLHYAFHSPTDVFLVTDFYQGGEIFYHLQKNGTMPEDVVRFWAAELALALIYLHSIGIVSRAVKTEDIVLDSEGHIHLIDFNLSKKIDKERTRTFCGTPEYLAPEILTGVAYGIEVDWWSFGCLVYELISGLPPFYHHDVQTMYSRILTGPLNFSAVFSEEAKQLVTKLLNRNVEERLGDDQIKAEPFFTGVDWKLLEQKKVKPPYVPTLQGPLDLSQFAPSFTSQAIDDKESNPPSSDPFDKTFYYAKKIEHLF